jgi:hypothetical protein
MKCVICGKQFTGYGHNADPISAEGQCCDKCNMDEVIPARVQIMYMIMSMNKTTNPTETKKKGGKAKWKKSKTKARK